MIKINAIEKNGVYSIEMQGHAGFNPGNDIVCAAASMLIQTLHGSLLNGIGGGVVKNAEFAHGSAKIEFMGCEILYLHTVLGFKMLEKAYPENVFFNQKK